MILPVSGVEGKGVPLVLVHDGKIGAPAVERHRLAVVGHFQGQVGGQLGPLAGPHPPPGEVEGFAPRDVLDLLDVSRVAGIGGDGRKADQQVLEGELLAVQLVHRSLKAAGTGAVHLHLVDLVGVAVVERRLIVGRVPDRHVPAARAAVQQDGLAGAVIGKGEKGGVVIVGQIDAGILGGLADLAARGELSVLIGHHPAAGVPVGHLGMVGVLK